MKAMRLNRLGEGEPFELFEKPDADPGPGEVAIRVAHGRGLSRELSEQA